MNYSVNRRKTVKVVATAAFAGGTFNIWAQSKPETLVKSFYDSLSTTQKKVMLFDWEHLKKGYVDNNWNIVDEDDYSIGKFYSSQQQKLIHSIFKSSLSEQGFKRYSKQIQDDSDGFANFTCGLFGAPGKEFEFVLTGRHLTLRADGNLTDKAAFGGPIFYGHATRFTEKADHKGNVWWHQAVLANAVYSSLDRGQKKKALLEKAPADNRKVINLKGKSGKFAGLAIKNMNESQKKLVQRTIDSLFISFKKPDVDEALKFIKEYGGMDALYISFYEQRDLGDDKIWDRWMIEGPGFVWYFRGSPHVHSWVNIGVPS